MATDVDDAAAAARKAKSREKYRRRIAKMSPEELEAFRAAAKVRARAWLKAKDVPGSEPRERRNARKRLARAKNPDKFKEDRKRWAAINREAKLAAKRAKYATATPEVVQKIKDGKRAYRQQNRDRIAAAKRAWDAANAKHRKEYAEANKDTLRERSRRLYHENKERYLSYVHARRARIAQAGGRYTPKDIVAIGDSQGWQCVYCMQDIETGYHIDHKTPLSRGGTNYPNNLQLLCAPCNLSKHAKTHEEYLRYREIVTM